MSQIVTINNTTLEQLQYQNTPVVTIQMIADVHGIRHDNIYKSFQRHQKRFKEGKHFFRVDTEDVAHTGLKVQCTPHGLLLFTEKGYLLLTKPLRDDKAWEVQELMIDEYFSLRITQESLQERRVKNPAHQMLIDTIVRLDEVEQRAIAAEAEAHAAEVRAVRAETKADMALDHVHRMTVEEFIIKNGLLEKWPYPEHVKIAKWLKHFCESYGLPTWKVPVHGKRWDEELAYPLQACAAWLRMALKEPKQLQIIKTKNN